MCGSGPSRGYRSAGLEGRRLASKPGAHDPCCAEYLVPVLLSMGKRDNSQQLRPLGNSCIKFQTHVSPGPGLRSTASVTVWSPLRLALAGGGAGGGWHSQRLSHQGPFPAFVLLAKPWYKLHVPQGRRGLFRVPDWHTGAPWVSCCLGTRTL